MGQQGGQVSWKHPFYDYFRQLRDFCRQSSREEVMQAPFFKMGFRGRFTEVSDRVEKVGLEWESYMDLESMKSHGNSSQIHH